MDGSPLPRRRPEGRYDEPTRPAWFVPLAAVLLGALVTAAVFGAMQRREDRRSPTTLLGYSVVDDSTVEVRFRVSKDADATVTCALRALDLQGRVVGQEDVRVPAGQREVTHRFATTSKAVLGEVVGCSGPQAP